MPLLIIIGKLIIDSDTFLGYFISYLFRFSCVMQVFTIDSFFDIESSPSLNHSSIRLKYR